MFSRALKVKFNDQKFTMVSIVRQRRIEHTDMPPTAKRLGLFFGILFSLQAIKWKRKDGIHKTNYTPYRKGLYKVKHEPMYMRMEPYMIPISNAPSIYDQKLD